MPKMKDSKDHVSNQNISPQIKNDKDKQETQNKVKENDDTYSSEDTYKSAQSVRDNTEKMGIKNLDKEHYLSNESLYSANSIYRTVLKIEEEEVNSLKTKVKRKNSTDNICKAISNPDFKGEFIQGENVDDISSGNFEEDETLSLLSEEDASGSTNERRKKYDDDEAKDQRSHHVGLIGTGKRLSIDAGEKVLHKMFEKHLEHYEEIPLDDKNENQSRQKSVEKIGYISPPPIPSQMLKSPRKRRGCCCCCGPVGKSIFGILSLFIGIYTLIYTPYEFLMNERLKMTPGLPAFDWWAFPPDDVYFKVYIFNVTNSDAFMRGEDNKLALDEIGPIVFKEKLQHSNITFNDNDTMTYLAKRWLVYLPDMNTIDYNATIIVPNIPVLGMASYLHNSFFIAKQGFKFFVNSHKSTMFINISIHDFLFNFTDPLMKIGQTFAPGLVPVSNMGLLSTMYLHPTDQLTVHIGPRWGENMFFTLDSFNGSPLLPGYHNIPSCKETVRGSTEGLLYMQRVTKNSTLLYWRKTLCRVVKLLYTDETSRNGLQAYKFTMPLNTYSRIHNTTYSDCFAGDPPMRDGLSDLSKCFFDFPMAISLPHFMGADPQITERLTGLHPDREKHESYVILETNSGIPMESMARSQSNLVMKKLSGFGKDIEKFSEMVLPSFWAEYSQLVLPNKVWALMIVQAKVVPIFQVFFSPFMVLLGVYLLYKVVKPLMRTWCCPRSFDRHKNINNLAKNAIFGYELEKRGSNLLH